jgi:cytochrome P450
LPYSAILFGANDATNAAFLHILHLLATHPAEQAKIRQEIVQAREVLGDWDGDGDLVYDWEEIEKMEWLDAVVKESLRMFVWSFLSLVVLNADTATGHLDCRQPSIHFSTRM